MEILGLVLAVLVFVAVMGGFVYLSKRMSGGTAFSGKRIKVIDRMMLSRDSYIMLVQIGLRLLAVGVGKGAPTVLCELSPSDFAEFSKKADEALKSPGFWNLFKRNVKAGFTGGGAVQTEENASFAAVLQQIAENDPVPGAENAGDAGSPHLWEEERRPAPPKFKRPGYQASIDNMARLSEPDTFDRRWRQRDAAPNVRQRDAASDVRQRDAAPDVRFAGTGGAYQEYAPPPEPPYEAVSEEDRSERIDQLLDLIAQRQSRMDGRNETGDMG